MKNHQHIASIVVGGEEQGDYLVPRPVRLNVSKRIYAGHQWSLFHNLDLEEEPVFDANGCVCPVDYPSHVQ